MPRKSGGLILILVVCIAVVFVFSFLSSEVLNPPTAIEVPECYLEPKSITSGNQTSIIVTVKSNDNEDPHLIRIEFKANERVTFFHRSQILPKTDGTWYYEYTIPSSTSLTEEIYVVPKLESGISELTYRISVAVFSDGKQTYDINLDLSVKL